MLEETGFQEYKCDPYRNNIILHTRIESLGSDPRYSSFYFSSWHPCTLVVDHASTHIAHDKDTCQQKWKFDMAAAFNWIREVRARQYRCLVKQIGFFVIVPKLWGVIGVQLGCGSCRSTCMVRLMGYNIKISYGICGCLDTWYLTCKR